MIMLETDIIKWIDTGGRYSMVLPILALLAFSVISFNHSYDFEDSKSFWANANRTSPHFWQGTDKGRFTLSAKSVI
jgi:hypothetical protein